MKKSELRNIIKEEIKKALKEGTWALPTNSQEILRATEYIKQVGRIQDKVYNILGDDELFDSFDNIIKKMKELIKKAPQGKNWKQ